MIKIDLKKQFKSLFQPSAENFSLVDVPEFAFLMIDGQGNPNTSPEYQEALRLLYPLAYKIKFMSKLELKRDYVVPPLEGLWWADDMSDFKNRNYDNWKWRMMIMQPDWISTDFVEAARDQIKDKISDDICNVRFDRFSEGKCVQILHRGSYDCEGPVLARMHTEWIPDNGLRETGHHHEIYLNDPRRIAPAKLKTILRQPVTDL